MTYTYRMASFYLFPRQMSINDLKIGSHSEDSGHGLDQVGCIRLSTSSYGESQYWTPSRTDQCLAREPFSGGHGTCLRAEIAAPGTSGASNGGAPGFARYARGRPLPLAGLLAALEGHRPTSRSMPSRRTIRKPTVWTPKNHTRAGTRTRHRRRSRTRAATPPTVVPPGLGIAFSGRSPRRRRGRGGRATRTPLRAGAAGPPGPAHPEIPPPSSLRTSTARPREAGLGR